MWSPISVATPPQVPTADAPAQGEAPQQQPEADNWQFRGDSQTLRDMARHQPTPLNAEDTGARFRELAPYEVTPSVVSTKPPARIDPSPNTAPVSPAGSDAAQAPDHASGPAAANGGEQRPPASGAHMDGVANARGYSSGRDQVMAPLDVFMHPALRTAHGRLIECARQIRAMEAQFRNPAVAADPAMQQAYEQTLAEHRNLFAQYADVRYELERQLVANNPQMASGLGDWRDDRGVNISWWTPGT